MDAGLRHILQNFQGEAAVYIELNYLLPELRKRNLVTEEEFLHLADERRNGSYERNKSLMSIIQTKGGEKSFDLFVKALQAEKQHTGHEYVAEKLIKAKAVLKNQLIRPEPPPRPFKKLQESTSDKSSVEDSILIMKAVDERLKTLEKDVKEIKEVVLAKSVEHKVGVVMQDLQEKIDALTRLVQSMKTDDYSYELTKENKSNGSPEIQYDDVCTHQSAVDNDYTENQYTRVVHTAPKAVAQKTAFPASYMALTPKTDEQDERKYERPVQVSQQKADYVEMDILAKGSTGEYWLAVNKKDRSKVVIKKPLETISSVVLGQEVHVLKCCQHPNVVRMITPLIGPSQASPSLVFEYAGRETLKRYLQTEQRSISISRLLAMAAGVACGMAELEKNGIIHCDLKAKSVLIDDDLVCRIASFNKALCLKNGETHKLCDSHRLCIRWQAPEILKDCKFSTKSDAWAFGVFLCEVFTHGSQPYPDMKADQVKQFVLAQKKMNKPDIKSSEFPKEVFALMKECFQFNTARRPTFTNLNAQLKHLQSKLHRTVSNESSESDEYT